MKQYTDEYEDIPVTLVGVKKFSLGESKYIVLETCYYSNLRSYSSQLHTFIFDVTGDAKLVPFLSSAFSTVKAYGDFDADGNLDYIHFNDECEASVLTWKDGKVRTSKNMVLKTKCVAISPEEELILIDAEKSKWPLQLRQAWEKQRRKPIVWPACIPIPID